MDWYWWAMLGTFFFILEILLPGFFMFFFGVSALLVAPFFLLLNIKNLWIQLLIYTIITASEIAVYIYSKPFRKFRTEKKTSYLDSAVIGMKGKVKSEITKDKPGIVALFSPVYGTSEWKAILKKDSPYDILSVGDTVEVVGVEGIKLIVEKLEE